jgi:dTDP-4-amino-4,6-dideoxygalactose transaminase
VKIIPHSFPAISMDDYKGLKDLFEKEYVGPDQNLNEKLKIKIKKYVASKHIHITPSGSIALLLALKYAGVQKNDEVIMTAINCWSVYNALIFMGAFPVICDVKGAGDFRASYDTIQRKITKKTKAIILTHMYGELFDLKDISELANQNGIKIIEDYSTSFGAIYGNGHRVGQLSDFTIGSFGSTKPLTGGIGGFFASKQLSIENLGISELPILNINISSLNQKLLIMQFEKVEEIKYAKSELIRFYSRFVNMWGNNNDRMFRFLTFEDISDLLEHSRNYKIAIDARNSVQPNIAKELNCDLDNAMNFKTYNSIPFHLKAYTEFKKGGLL